MKILLFTLLFLSFLTQASQLDSQAQSIQYNASSQTYTLSADKITGHALLSFFGLQSGLGIRFSPSLSQQEYLLPTILSEQELIRWLKNNLSTVQGFNKQQELISLTILPKGQFHSDELIFANDPVNEGQAHQLGQTSTSAKQRFKLRIKEFSQAQQQQLTRQIDRNIARDLETKAREKDRLAKRNAKQDTLVKQLKALKLEDPELYARILAVNKNRYPELEAKILQE